MLRTTAFTVSASVDLRGCVEGGREGEWMKRRERWRERQSEVEGGKGAEAYICSGSQVRELDSFIGPGSSAFLKLSCTSNLGFQRIA